MTCIGKRKPRVPRDRNGEFSTALFERYQRSEKALVGALAEMYVQGGAFDCGEALNCCRGTLHRASATMTRPRRWEKAVGDQEMRAPWVCAKRCCGLRLLGIQHQPARAQAGPGLGSLCPPPAHPDSTRHRLHPASTGVRRILTPRAIRYASPHAPSVASDVLRHSVCPAAIDRRQYGKTGLNDRPMVGYCREKQSQRRKQASDEEGEHLRYTR